MIDLNVYNTCVFVPCKVMSTVSLYIEQPSYKSSIYNDGFEFM